MMVVQFAVTQKNQSAIAILALIYVRNRKGYTSMVDVHSRSEIGFRLADDKFSI